MHHKQLAHIWLLVLATLACVGKHWVDANFDVHVVHTGYVRGHVFPTKSSTECDVTASVEDPLCLGGCARRNGYIKQARTLDPNVMAVDGGGYYWGSVFLYFFGTDPHIRCVTEAEYDLTTIAGSDFYVRDLGQFVHYFRNIKNSLSNPIMVTNLDFSLVASDTSVIGDLADVPFASYTVMTRGGVKVGYISLISSYYANQKVPASIRFNVAMSDLNHARVAISRMRSDNPDLKVIVALVELNTLFDVVENVKELEHVDIVLKSRAATSEVPFTTQNIYGKTILVSPARDSGTYISDIKVTFDDDGNYVSHTGGPVLLDQSQPFDTETWDAIKEFEPMSNPQYSEKVGSATAPVFGERGPDSGLCTSSSWGCRCFACPAGELVTRAMLSACPRAPSERACDIALVNGGSIRSSIPATEVSFADIVKVLPFFNSLVAFDVLGSHIRAAMVNGISTGPGGGHYPQTNIRYVVNQDLSKATDNDHSQRIMDLQIRDSTGNWVALEDTKKYRMVTNDYVFAGLDGYTMLTAANVENVEEIGVEQVRVVADYFSSTTSAIRVQTREEAESCIDETRPPSESGCMAAFTDLLRNEYEKCPTNSQVCAANTGTSIFDGIFVTSNCDECSGLGYCKDKACECSGIGMDEFDNPYVYVKGIPTTGLFAGIEMVRGSTCSDFRKIWKLTNSERSSMYAAAALSFVCTAVFLALLLATCTKPVIRATAPTFSVVMCVGSFIGTIGIVLDAETHTEQICNASLWLYLVGYAVLFTSIFVKTHRIHYVFNSKLLKNRMDYTDGKVALYILCLVGIEVILLIIFSTVSPLVPAPVKQEDHFQVALLCSSKNNTVAAVLICFNVLLMVWGVYLAVRTRHVESNYNESRWIAFAIYNCAFSCVIILLVMFIVVDNVPGAAYSIKAWIVAYLCISTQAILFGPRFYLLYKGISEVQATTSPSSTSAVDIRNNPHSKFLVQRLRDQNQLIHERDTVVRQLTKVLQDHQLPVPNYVLRTLDDLTASTSPSAGHTNSTIGQGNSGSSGDAQQPTGNETGMSSTPIAAAASTAGPTSTPVSVAAAPRRPLFGLGNHRGRPRGGASAGAGLSTFHSAAPYMSPKTPEAETSAADVHATFQGVATNSPPPPLPPVPLAPLSTSSESARISSLPSIPRLPASTAELDMDFTPPPPPPPPVPEMPPLESVSVSRGNVPSLPLPQPPK